MLDSVLDSNLSKAQRDQFMYDYFEFKDNYESGRWPIMWQEDGKERRASFDDVFKKASYWDMSQLCMYTPIFFAYSDDYTRVRMMFAQSGNGMWVWDLDCVREHHVGTYQSIEMELCAFPREHWFIQFIEKHFPYLFLTGTFDTAKSIDE